MSKNYCCRLTGCFFVFLLCVLPVQASGDEDPWQRLRDTMTDESTDSESTTDGLDNAKPVAYTVPKPEDPWVKLRGIYLPFSAEDEAAAATSAAAGKKVSRGLHKAVAAYSDLIDEASAIFQVPREIISAVIMVESGGNPNARAKTSSASGLMQTIASTFRFARKGLAQKGILISDSPYDPRSSIMAGTWYLNRMFDRAIVDRRVTAEQRLQIDAWKLPLEYYYAGPVHGAKKNDVVIIYAGGKEIVVDKLAYSQKVLKWAEIMKTSV